MLRSESNLALLIVGNPENRRVKDFQSTAVRLHLGSTECVSWSSLLEHWDSAIGRLQVAEEIRLESPGENDQVLHQLIRLGGSTQRLEFAQIGLLREYYFGFRKILEQIHSNVVERCRGIKFQNSPLDIVAMFDKWRSHQRFVQIGLRRPKTLLAPKNVTEFKTFRADFGTPSCGRLFLKPRYGSSASGVCAYQWAPGREQLIAPIEIRRSQKGVQLFNSLKVKRYTKLADINEILNALLPQDMIAEKWIQKINLEGEKIDFRVLVVAGEARHMVARQSVYPMTNLHLGNRRADWKTVVDVIGDDKIEACRELAQHAAHCFPDSLYAGVDVLLPAKGDPLICEINSFGDLLPNLRHRGESTYESILKATNVCCGTF